jgi:hypothetical protein
MLYRDSGQLVAPINERVEGSGRRAAFRQSADFPRYSHSVQARRYANGVRPEFGGRSSERKTSLKLNWISVQPQTQGSTRLEIVLFGVPRNSKGVLHPASQALKSEGQPVVCKVIVATLWASSGHGSYCCMSRGPGKKNATNTRTDRRRWDH